MIRFSRSQSILVFRWAFRSLCNAYFVAVWCRPGHHCNTCTCTQHNTTVRYTAEGRPCIKRVPEQGTEGLATICYRKWIIYRSRTGRIEVWGQDGLKLAVYNLHKTTMHNARKWIIYRVGHSGLGALEYMNTDMRLLVPSAPGHIPPPLICIPVHQQHRVEKSARAHPLICVPVPQ